MGVFATKVDILGVAFDNLTKTEAVSQAMELAQTGQGAYVVTPNPEIIRAARENHSLAQAIEGAALVLADGIGVVKAADILKRPLQERIPGIDFAAALMKKMGEQSLRLFLLGAKPGVAEQAAQQLEGTYPGLVVCGTHDGYFQDDEAVARIVAAAAPHVVFVCLGAPRQELWMQQYGAMTGAGLLAGLGGSLDIFAGNSKRAPVWMQKAGLEWLYRLIKEPWRIGRMMKIPGVLLWAWRERGDPS